MDTRFTARRRMAIVLALCLSAFLSGGLFDGPDLRVGHRQQAPAGVGGRQPRGGVGEDQAAFFGEPEQRPHRDGRVRS